jgi:phospholipid/cholesterol/gamma-HCH transport system permease protein
VGWKSLPLVLASGFALGVVLTLHTRSSLVRFGAEAMIPTFQAVAFFNEIGPLVVGLLVAGRVGAGIVATLFRFLLCRTPVRDTRSCECGCVSKS